ncbi:MAG TPA: 50S ribosomal protein L25, partial [Patescibacteria group bacterium]|nr:50S ribosomal protein L25 [Patescibacteria group bacterium]
QVEAFPRDLPDEVTVSQENLVEIGDKITVADIIVPNNVTILTEPEHSIAVVEELKEPEPEEVEEEIPAEEAAEGTEESPAEDTQKAEESK